MALSLVAAPALEPVSTAEAKAHLRVDISDDDTLIAGLVATARRHVERQLSRALITQTWDLLLDDWPDDVLEMPLPPLQAVTSIQYVDEDGVTATFGSANYQVDTESTPGRVALVNGASWPTATLRPLAGIRISFDAGYGDEAADVPETLVQAIKLLVGHWYENRESVLASGAIPKEFPFAVTALLLSEAWELYPR